MAHWLTGYDRRWLRADLLAGLTTAAVVIPKAMAVAVIAGLPVEAGLYTALAAMLVYPLLGSSRPLSVSSTSAIAMLAAASIIDSEAVDGATPATVAAALALLVGGFLVLARVLRLGFLASFISKPVLVGFAAGVGVAVIIGQAGALLGVPIESKSALGILGELPAQLARVHLPTLALALAGIALLVGMHHRLPRWPAPLVWIAGAIAASALLGMGTHGIALVGAVPAGLPVPTVPDLELLRHLWPAAMGIALLAFTESVAAAQTFAERGDPPVDTHRELLALGAVNVAVACVGGLPAGGSTSQTAVNDQAGARSQMAQWVGAAAAVATLLFLADIIGLLPEAALAALVVVVSAGMVNPADFRAIARVRRSEWSWAVVTFAGVVLVGTLEGIGIAVLVSAVTLIHQANHPPVYAVAFNRALGIFRRLGDNPADETVPGLLMLRAEGRLNFANAANAQQKMQALAAAATPAPRVIVLECSAIPDIEYTALTMLVEAERNQHEHGVSLWLAGLNPGFEQVIDRSPLGPVMGPGRRFHNLRQALEAFERDQRAP
jgi:high affinity sulfate transporter 1